MNSQFVSLPRDDFGNYKPCQKKTGRKYTEQDYQIIAKSKTLVSLVLFQHWLNTPNLNVSIRRNPAPPTLCPKSLEQRGVSTVCSQTFIQIQLHSVTFPKPQKSQNCHCPTRVVSLSGGSSVTYCHHWPPALLPHRWTGGEALTLSRHRALPGTAGRQVELQAV